MKKLNKNSRIAEVADIANRMVYLFEKETVIKDDEVLKKVFANISQSSAKLIDAIKSDRILSDLKVADKVRDEAIRRLEKMLKGYSVMPIESIQKTGKKLYGVFAKYGVGITRKSYSEESAYIKALLIDFSMEDIKADVESLTGLKEILTEIDTVQKAFDKKRMDYEKLITGNTYKSQTYTLKMDIVSKINNIIVPYLISSKNTNPDAFTNFANVTDKVISDINALVKSRSKVKNDKVKNENKAEETTT